MIELSVNGEQVALDVDPRKPLVWVLREDLAMTGTKFCCGSGQCGICMVHVDGRAVRSCVMPLAEAQGRRVVTIESLANEPDNPLIAAWVAERVPQCGYCQPGQVMAAAALLAADPRPSDTAIDRAMSVVLCRCGTYPRVRRALARAATAMAEQR